MGVGSGLNIADRSFNYGDGIFTTMQVAKGEIQLWPLHLQRLQQGVARLGMVAPEWQQLTEQVQNAITQPYQVVKVLISRGEGGRGYSPSGITRPGVYISTAAMPDYQLWQQQGITLAVASLRLSVQPALAGLKHTSRLEQVLLKQELLKSQTDELLVLDQAGFVTEVSAANVFFYCKQQWYTPELSRAGVAGVMRQHILQQRPDIQQINWQLSDLGLPEAICITNALMHIVPVAMFNGQALALEPVQTLQQSIRC